MKKRIYLIAIVAVAVVGGFLAVRALVVQVNRWQFSYAETAANSVFADAVEHMPKPVATAAQHSCTRQHRKFGDGPPYCTVGSVAVYTVDDISQANQLQHAFRDYIRRHPGKFVYSNNSGFHDFTSMQHYSSEEYTLGRTAMTCGPTYSLSTASNPEHGLPKVTATSDYLLAFRMNCAKGALRQYYPRSDT
jgi:hypothetical protein